MAEYDNKSTWVLFKNEKKEKEKQPDYTGKMTDENGKEWNIAGWVKESKAGRKFISGNIQEPQKKEDGPSSSEQAQQQDDDLPF